MREADAHRTIKIKWGTPVASHAQEVLANGKVAVKEFGISERDTPKVEAVAVVLVRFVEPERVACSGLLHTGGGPNLQLTKPGVPAAGKSLGMVLLLKQE